MVNVAVFITADSVLHILKQLLSKSSHTFRIDWGENVYFTVSLEVYSSTKPLMPLSTMFLDPDMSVLRWIFLIWGWGC